MYFTFTSIELTIINVRCFLPFVHVLLICAYILVYNTGKGPVNKQAVNDIPTLSLLHWDHIYIYTYAMSICEGMNMKEPNTNPCTRHIIDLKPESNY